MRVLLKENRVDINYKKSRILKELNHIKGNSDLKMELIRIVKKL